MFKLSFLILFSFLFTTEIDITSLINSNNLKLKINSKEQKYIFNNKNTTLVFQEGNNIVFYNGLYLYTDYPIRFVKNKIYTGNNIYVLLNNLLSKKIKTKNNMNKIIIKKNSLNIIKSNRTNIKDKEFTSEDKKYLNEEVNIARQFKIGGNYKINYIIIDPGHGGKDSGALGYGYKEKNFALKIAKNIKKNLNFKLINVFSYPIKVKLTRTNDVFIPLQKRTEIANNYLGKKDNGIFIRIHLNADLNPQSSGIEYYYVSFTPISERARIVSLLENKPFDMKSNDLKLYHNIKKIFGRMTVVEYQKESHYLAQTIRKYILINKKQLNIQDRGIKSALFYVLAGSMMPAVLIECAYITNKKDIIKILNNDKFEKLTKSISLGIIDFIKKFNSGKEFAYTK